MGLTCTVGGTRGAFEGPAATEVAGLLGRAFGAEGEWTDAAVLPFGEVTSDSWGELQERAVGELGADELPNLLALGERARGVYLPAHVQAMSLTLSAGASLRCASLPGLRSELAALAERWELSLDDETLQDILRVALDPDDGFVADAPEVLAFARLALAANDAVRRDCPLWLLGG